MQQTPKEFFDSIREKKVAFLGIGVSNTDTMKFFALQGITVIACDKKEEIDVVLEDELKRLGIDLRLGEHYLDNLDADIIIRSPGFYYHRPELKTFRQQGKIITSEMELFFDLCPCPIIAVTGSDGKTTTTTLIAQMLLTQDKTVHLGGNIGKALLPEILMIRPSDWAVVELSSFQLISMRRSPEIAVITNVTPNHLDVHGEMQEYIDAKKNIYLHQNAFGKTVLNADNEITASFASELRGQGTFFSLEKKVENGAYLREDGRLTLAHHGKDIPLFHRDQIRIPGIHNVANYLAAMSAVDGLVDPEQMKKVAQEFGGVEHRIEFVREKDGVKWYNDSIATSPTRVIAGLRSFGQKIIVIAGGYDKKIPFEPLAPELIEHTKLLILTGDTADKIENAVKANENYHGLPAIVRASSLENAVQIADKQSSCGDVVSLSPACASFDCYPNFEARGQHFKQLVLSL